MKQKTFNNLLKSILKELDKTMRYPDSRICKHLVACNFGSMLEQDYNIQIDEDVIKSIVRADYEYNENYKNLKKIK